MNPAYLRPIADHLWQSTLFAAVAGLLTLTLRSNRARVRYWLWLTASCKFLVPLSVLVTLGGQLAPPKLQPTTRPSFSMAVQMASQPFTASAISVPFLPSPAVARPSLPQVLWVIWVFGFGAISWAWFIRWRRIVQTVASASPVPVSISIPVKSSPKLLEPGIFGIYRPVLLLPEGIFERLTAKQMQAVVAHELCHVRYWDNLTAAIHMFVETVFWFHPLVWWVGRRMIEERERACDEEVLRLGSDPQAYAEGILNICKFYMESPLACVSGVSGANLRKRISVILSNPSTIRLSFANKIILTVAGLTALGLPITLGIINAPISRAQSSSSASSVRAAAPKFEVASIKLCRESGSGSGRKTGGRAGNSSPGSLRLECTTVASLIKQAYVLFADGHVNPRSRVAVGGGPAWINSTTYRIDAKPSGPQSQGMMHGPMLQTLLEDRFKLKIHRESREVPAYAVTVAKGGPKLHPFQKGSCTPLDLTILEQFPPPPFPELPAGQTYCGGIDPNDGTRWVATLTTKKGPTVTVEAKAMSIDEFIKHSLGPNLDRPVINQTGIPGLFDFHLEYVPDEPLPTFSDSVPSAGGPPPPEQTGPSIFTALQQQLGLKLEPAKGVGDFLVIDHVEKPTPN
jgi:uncharacterized protein (TIGR03435 family)